MKAFYRYLEQLGRIKLLIELFKLKSVTCELDIYNTNKTAALRLKWHAPWPDKLRRQSELAAIEDILSSKDAEEFDDTLTEHELLFLNAWKHETVWVNYKMRFEKPEDYTVYLKDLSQEEWIALRDSIKEYLVKEDDEVLKHYISLTSTK
jgi:hypothetical protein